MGRVRAADRSSLPEPLRWDAERPVEARGRVLPRDDHRQLRDGVVVVVSLHAREKLVVDVAARVRDRVGVFERHLLRVAEERALRIAAERVDLLRRDAVPAAHGSIDVLSELAAVPRGHAPIEQRPERDGHALRLLLESGPHRLRGAEVCRVSRVEEVRIERRAPELALFFELFAQVIRECLDVDRRDARFSFEHGHLLHVLLSANHGRDLTSESAGRADEHFDDDRSVTGCYIERVTTGPLIAEIAGLVGEPARATMLSALLDGRALTATVLACAARVTPQTASTHLAKLAGAGLVAPIRDGRYRYFRLASPRVAQMLDGTMAVVLEKRPRYRPLSRQARELNAARICYDPLAGRLSVDLTDSLITHEYIVVADETAEITRAGTRFLTELGINLSALR